MAIFTAIYAFITAHAVELLGLWVLFEQVLASNRKIKANSTFQLVSSVIKTFLNKSAKR
jgi:hypothetical protein